MRMVARVSGRIKDGRDDPVIVAIRRAVFHRGAVIAAGTVIRVYYRNIPSDAAETGGPRMSVAASPRLMTTEELLALPDDGTERWLINGQLREKRQPGEKPMTVRNRWHSRIMVRVGKLLDNWLDQQPRPRGSVLGGE